jgi:hypothetical protein
MWANSVIFKNLPKKINHPLGKNSLNLVTQLCGATTASRVTRLGEFSPNGICLLLGEFLIITEVTPIFWATLFD